MAVAVKNSAFVADFLFIIVVMRLESLTNVLALGGVNPVLVGHDP